MSTSTAQNLNLNYKSTFTEAISPFNISVNDDFLALTKLKVSLTRFINTEDHGDITDGPLSQISKSVASYWTQKYDWRKIEASINSQLSQYTTIVHPSASPANYTSPTPVHFVHHRSDRPDAIPLLFVHGWPGSFLEVDNIISALTHPPKQSLPAFHVVAPSIPGYGFSPSPRAPGFGYRAAGATFHALMLKLGYHKYVFQGGDAGDFINRYAAHDFPESVVSGLSNFWVIPPNETDLERYGKKQTSEDENYIIELLGSFLTSGWAYGQIQQTKPLKLATGLMDSPVGLAMWIYESAAGVEPDPSIWTEERVITWTMMHWINGPYGAFSLYSNGAKDGAISTSGINLLPYVKQPVAISQFPHDVWYRTPLDWARRGGNVVQNTIHETGGHFASLTTPDLLLEDIWRFFGNQELSATYVFLKG